MASHSPAVRAPALPAELRRKVGWRLLPYLFVIYVIAFLDRVNISYAALAMRGDLHFSSEVLGTGMGVFFLGYFLLEIPSTWLVERWSARRWMARIMVTWGVVAMATSLVHSATAFYWLRFLLGAAEAGFFPGLIVYLGHWFTAEDKGKAVALFMAALPVAFLFGAPVSGAMLGLHWLGWAGWRWLFVLEGAPAIVFGLLNLRVLTDWPREARWLGSGQQAELAAAIDREAEPQPARLSVGAFFRQVQVWQLALVYLFICSASYGFGLWLPSLLKRAAPGASNFAVSLWAALPYAVALACLILFGWSSDRRRERRWHTAAAVWLMAAGLLLAAYGRQLHGPAAWGWTLGGFLLAGTGVYSYMPSFWALPSSYLSGTALAVAVGAINSIGNLGGFVGPFLMGWMETRTGSFALGMVLLAVLLLASGVLALALPPPP
ncbi:MAG: MFS transporter [Terriglobales bacterium]